MSLLREPSPAHLAPGAASRKQGGHSLAVPLPGGSKDSDTAALAVTPQAATWASSRSHALALPWGCPRLFPTPAPLVPGPVSCHFSDASAGM